MVLHTKVQPKVYQNKNIYRQRLRFVHAATLNIQTIDRSTTTSNVTDTEYIYEYLFCGKVTLINKK